MSQKCLGAIFGVSPPKCSRNVGKRSGGRVGRRRNVQKMTKNDLRSVFIFVRHFKAIFVTLNAPRGRGGEAAATSGSLYGAENGLKMSKKCPKDIFLTFFGHFAGARPDPRTFSRHFLDILGETPRKWPQDIF